MSEEYAIEAVEPNLEVGVETVLLSDKLLQCRSELLFFLNGLYIGAPNRYKLQFRRRHLSNVQRIFDQIIAQHGIRGADFEFEITEDP